MKSLPATNKPVAYLQGIEDIAISSGYTAGIVYIVQV